MHGYQMVTSGCRKSTKRPFRVKSCPRSHEKRLPLFPQQPTLRRMIGMSRRCRTRTLEPDVICKVYRSVGRRRNFKNSAVVNDRYIRLREGEGSPEGNLIGGQNRSAERVLQRFDDANSAKPVSADKH